MEHLGAESWVHLKTKAHQLTLRCEPNAVPRPATGITLTVDPAGLRFFDGKDETALV